MRQLVSLINGWFGESLYLDATDLCDGGMAPAAGILWRPPVDYQLEELSIELSARCMCRCIMCSSGSTPKPVANELKPDEVESLIIQAREMGATVLSFSGGDPLLLYEIVPEYIRLALHLGYERILFYTTGVSGSYSKYAMYGASTVDIIHAHIQHKLERFLEALDDIPNVKDHLVFVFSLHSHKAHVHNYIMGINDALCVTISSIQMVVGMDYKAWVHMVPMLPNWDHVIPLRKLCGQLGVEKMSLLRYVPQTRGMVNRRRLALNMDEFTELQEIMVDLSYYHSSQDASQLPIVRFGCPIDFRHTVDNVLKEKMHQCHAGTDLMLVRPQGDVHPCAAWKTLPDDANIRTSTLKEIWDHNHVFTAIRIFREAGWMDLGGPCSMCEYLGSCKGGCPAQKLHWLAMNKAWDVDVSMDDLSWPIADPMCPLDGTGH